MSKEVLNDISHRRWNPLKGSYILCSPHRTKRPWQGQQESASKTTLPTYDKKCYLCPGNARAGGAVNPKYSDTFIFVNDYSAVKESQAEYTPDVADEEFFRAEPVTGKCYVLTFSPAHNLTLADMQPSEILPIIHTWTKLYAIHLDSESVLGNAARPILSSLSGDNIVVAAGKQLRYMQIFENKGAAMGCSNPHPHGQVWTTSSLPEEIDCELKQLRKYRDSHAGKHMLEDYAALESQRQERIVFQNSNFLVVCPWWAVWPFEVMIIPRHHLRALVDFTDTDRSDLAEAIAEVTRRYDNLFETQFPYSMGIHQAPLSGTQEEMDDSYFHMHFYPPLLRSATVRKFLVGYEMLAEPQRDITPEQAAARLRECGGVLYRKNL